MLMDAELRVDTISDAFGSCDGIEKYCQYRALHILKMNGINCLTKAQGPRSFSLTELSWLQ